MFLLTRYPLQAFAAVSLAVLSGCAQPHKQQTNDNQVSASSTAATDNNAKISSPGVMGGSATYSPTGDVKITCTAGMKPSITQLGIIKGKIATCVKDGSISNSH